MTLILIISTLTTLHYPTLHMHVWNVATGKEGTLCTNSNEFAVLLKECSELAGVAVSPDASHVVTCTWRNGTHSVWNMMSGKELVSFQGRVSPGKNMRVVVTPDGVHVVSCSYNTVRMWKLHTGEETMVFKGYDNNVYGVAVTPDGSRVVSHSHNENTLRVWDAGGKVVS